MAQRLAGNNLFGLFCGFTNAVGRRSFVAEREIL
jgi:hypothetical protein